MLSFVFAILVLLGALASVNGQRSRCGATCAGFFDSQVAFESLTLCNHTCTTYFGDFDGCVASCPQTSSPKTCIQSCGISLKAQLLSASELFCRQWYQPRSDSQLSYASCVTGGELAFKAEVDEDCETFCHQIGGDHNACALGCYHDMEAIAERGESAAQLVKQEAPALGATSSTQAPQPSVSSLFCVLNGDPTSPSFETLLFACTTGQQLVLHGKRSSSCDACSLLFYSREEKAACAQGCSSAASSSIPIVARSIDTETGVSQASIAQCAQSYRTTRQISSCEAGIGMYTSTLVECRVQCELRYFSFLDVSSCSFGCFLADNQNPTTTTAPPTTLGRSGLPGLNFTIFMSRYQ
jgi:hypothetical protein